jgi:hypothetical protein
MEACKLATGWAKKSVENWRRSVSNELLESGSEMAIKIPVYEAHGKEPDGSLFSVEVIGGMEPPLTEEQSIEIARDYCKRWGKTVDLYEVPYVNLSSTSFAESEMRFIIRLEP